MNKMVKMAMFLVALTATTSFADSYGFRAGFSLYDYSTGNSAKDKYVKMGYGFGGGLVVNKSLSSSFNYVQEANFLYRKPVIMDISDIYGSGAEMYITELALSTPMMFRFTPVEDMPLYLAAGVQLDVLISSKTTMKIGGQEESEDTEDRVSLDFGIVLGIGYLITPNIGVDIRAVIGLTEPTKNKEDSWKQYGAGLTYYF